MKRSGLALALVLLVILAGFAFLVQGDGLPDATSPGGLLATGSADIQQAAEEPTPPASDEAATFPTEWFENFFPSPLPTPTSVPDLSGRLAQYSFTETENRHLDKSPGGWARIGDWLPDNQTVILESSSDESQYLGYYQILTQKRLTGEVVAYGLRWGAFMHQQPNWLEDLQMMSFVGSTEGGDESIVGVEPLNLWITSAGTIMPEFPALENVIAAAGRGHTVVALMDSPRQLVQLDAKSGEKSVLPIDVGKYGEGHNRYYTQMAWHPTLPLVAIFSREHFGILDLAQNTLQEVDLGENPDYLPEPKRWAMEVEWNPLDASLAALTTFGDLPLSHMDPIVLNEKHELESVFERRYPIFVTDSEWAPNGLDLLVYGSLQEKGEAHVEIVDTQSKASQFVDATSWNAAPGFVGWGVAWSLNGEALLVRGQTQNTLLSVVLP